MSKNITANSGLITELKKIVKASKNGNFSIELDGSQFLHEEAEVIGLIKEFVGNYRAAEDNKQAHDEIEQRDRLLYAANSATAFLLDIDVESFEVSLFKSMQTIAEAVEIHRVCIWKNYVKDGGMHCALLHDWVSDLRPQINGDFLKEVSYDDTLHGWYATLSQGNCINRRVSEMSPDEQAQLEPQRIQSLFVAPIFLNDTFWGYIGYDDCRKERVFTEHEAMIMRSAGWLIANAITRHDMERDIMEKSELNRIMFDCAPIGLTVFDEDCNIIDCNNAILVQYGISKEYYLKNFYSLSPEYQPDEQSSRKKILDSMKKALAGEIVKMEWMHQTPFGDKIPCEVTMTRIKQGDKYIGLG
jgi:PAS domain-containing protein